MTLLKGLFGFSICIVFLGLTKGKFLVHFTTESFTPTTYISIIYMSGSAWFHCTNSNKCSQSTQQTLVIIGTVFFFHYFGIFSLFDSESGQVLQWSPRSGWLKSGSFRMHRYIWPGRESFSTCKELQRNTKQRHVWWRLFW